MINQLNFGVQIFVSGMQKKELLARLAELKVATYMGVDVEDLTATELEALYQDLTSKKTEGMGEDNPKELKLKKDPMAGLERLCRTQLDQIHLDLTLQNAESLKNKGLVMLGIRRGLKDLDSLPIQIGKNKGRPHEALKDQVGYLQWMMKEGVCREKSDFRLVRMYQYLRLHYGLLPDKPQKETPVIPELEKEVPIDEPFLLIEELPKKGSSKASSSVKMEMKTEFKREKTSVTTGTGMPVWDGKPENFTKFQVELGVWMAKTSENVLLEKNMTDAAKRTVPQDEDF